MLRTTLGKQNQAEQVLASGFFTQPKQQVRSRPTTAGLVGRRHQVVGCLHQFMENKNREDQEAVETRENATGSRIRQHSTIVSGCASEKAFVYDKVKTDITRMNAEKEKEENKVTENFEELNETQIEFLVDDQKRRLKQVTHQRKVEKRYQKVDHSNYAQHMDSQREVRNIKLFNFYKKDWAHQEERMTN